MRIRSSNTFKNESSWKSWAIYSSPTETTWTAYSSGNATLCGTARTMYDTVTPGFRKRVANGEIIMNNMSKTEWSRASYGYQGFHLVAASGSPPRQFRIDGDYFSAKVFGQNSAVLIEDLVDTSPNSSLVTEACTKVLSDRGRSDSNLWESLAEINSTLAMITDLLLAIRRLNFQAYRRAGVSGNYLQWRYGVSPLIADLQAALEGLQKRVGKVRKFTRASSSEDATVTKNGSFVYDSRMNVSYTRKITHVASVRAVSVDEFFADLGFNLGFSMKGLLTLPWELLGYSFVYDWFANIGDYIGALIPSLSWNQLGSCYTLTSEKTCITTCGSSSMIPGNGYNLLSPMKGVVVEKYIEKSRAPLSLPGLVLRSDFRFNKVTRVGDALALAMQSLPRRF